MAQPEEALWLAVPAAAAAAWGTAALMRRAALRRVWDQPPTPLSQLHKGQLARIEGAIGAGEQMLTSPIRKLPCVAYNAYVEYLDGDGPTRVPCWFPAANETRVASFRLLGDNGLSIAVDATRFEVEILIPSLPRRTDVAWETVEPVLRRAGDPRLLRDRVLGCVEVALVPGTRVTLVGRVLRPPRRGQGAYRAAAIDAQIGPPGRGPVQLRLVG